MHCELPEGADREKKRKTAYLNKLCLKTSQSEEGNGCPDSRNPINFYYDKPKEVYTHSRKAIYGI